MVRLHRAQIHSRQRPPGSLGPLGVDITMKSAVSWARAFAPTWGMVLGSKNYHAQQRGEAIKYRDHPPLSEAAYEAAYAQLLERVPHETWRSLWQLAQAQGGALTLLCYCRPGEFCHTHTMIAWMVQRWPHRFEDGRDAHDHYPPCACEAGEERTDAAA